MGYKLEFRPYQRHFSKPLKTSHGIWKIREGILLRLLDNEGRIGWGEIAPLPWFGSETFEEALAFSQQLDQEVTKEDISTIPLKLTACQFGFESALECLSLIESQEERKKIRAIRGEGREEEEEDNYSTNLEYSYLLPAGEDALQVWQAVWEERKKITQLPITFKWKIGVEPFTEEIKVFQQLTQVLPNTTKLRLDANGGLSLTEAREWLRIADKKRIVEFIEQPLSPQLFETMLELSNRYTTPLALDESVANLVQLEDCYQKGWRGIFVIKAAIAGSPQRLRQFCQDYAIDTVFSSVFETAIGRKAVLKLAGELSNPNRAVGFGVNYWFKEDEEKWLTSLWQKS